MDFKLELVLIPVADVDRAKAFYAEKAGFTLDVDHQPNDNFRVVQLTPPGSACSITFGKGITDAAPGLMHEHAGRRRDEAWRLRQGDWLPSPEDREFVSGLMQRVIEPGKMAGWIAPPEIGINNAPFDYEYVRLN